MKRLIVKKTIKDKNGKTRIIKEVVNIPDYNDDIINENNKINNDNKFTDAKPQTSTVP